MKRWSSPCTVRIWPGQESSMTRLPSASPSSTCPLASTIAGCTPKNGLVADPGLVGIAPGSGEIMMPPVSVCHQVSTIGRSEEHTSELQSLMRISYAVFCLKKKTKNKYITDTRYYKNIYIS